MIYHRFDRFELMSAASKASVRGTCIEGVKTGTYREENDGKRRGKPQTDI